MPLAGKPEKKTKALRFRACADPAARAVGGVMILLVRAYQFGIAPLLIGHCKFVPSCSAYFIEAVQRHGPLRGGWLGIRRILRCRPFSPGGIDPVP